MKIRELLERLDTPFDPWFSMDEGLIEELTGSNYFDINLEEHGFRSRPVVRWLCTDTHVGLNLIYYKNEPICFSKQECRRCSISFEWFSRETFDRVRKIVEDIIREKDARSPSLIDLDAEFGGETFSLDYSEQVTVNTVLYKGEAAKVVQRHHTSAKMDKITIQIGNTTKIVEMTDILVPIPLKDTT